MGEKNNVEDDVSELENEILLLEIVKKTKRKKVERRLWLVVRQ